MANLNSLCHPSRVTWRNGRSCCQEQAEAQKCSVTVAPRNLQVASRLYERDSSRINKILKHILIFIWGNDFNSFFRQTLTRWPYLVWNLLRDNLSLHFQHPFALSLWLLELRECAITPTLILAHLKFTCNLKTLLSLCCYEQCHYINIFLMPLFQGHWTVARFSAQLL